LPESFDYDAEEGFYDPDFEPDPAIIAQLDQDSAAFAETREQFIEMYGFDHDCHCAQDYAEGKVSTVTECYLDLIDDAMETCAKLNWEKQTLEKAAGTLADLSTKLIQQYERINSVDDYSESEDGDNDDSLDSDETA
jgi:hypothetical protein